MPLEHEHASTHGRVPLPTPFTPIPRLSPLANTTPGHLASLFHVRTRVRRHPQEPQRCRTTSSSMTTLSWTLPSSPFSMLKNQSTSIRLRTFNRTHGLPRLSLLHLRRNDRGRMTMEGGNIQPQGLVTEMGNLHCETRRGRIASMRICRISRLQAMAYMACTLRDPSTLGARIIPLLQVSRIR